MAEVKLSKAQQAIVDADIGNILVSAAAGSGKTKVLVERIIDKMIKGEFEVDDILVVTFTKEAAKNMADRIEKEIRSVLATTEDIQKKTQLRRQLDLLPNCYIQTFDAFCTRVIKERGYVCADTKYQVLLESSSSILDENELDIMRANAAFNAIADMYEDSTEGFLSLTDMFGDGRTDYQLVEAIVTTYKKLRSLPDYIRNECDDVITRMKNEDDEGIIRGLKEFTEACISLYRLVTPELISELEECALTVQFLASKNEQRQNDMIATTNAIGEYAQRVVEVFDNCNGDYLSVYEAMRDVKVILDSGKINGLGKGEDAEEYNSLMGPLAAIVALIKPLILSGNMPGGYNAACVGYALPAAYTNLIKVPSDELLMLQKKRTSAIEAYIEILRKTDDYYLRIKSGMRGMDFADQEHLASLILDDEESKDYYKNKFKEIYIDEYQDNSAIQDAIIDKIANDNVFRVGDVKQSIYRFRYAKPQLFLDRQAEYGSGVGGSLYNLNCNYRSTPQILEFINKIFEQVMSSEGSEIEYDENHRLNSPEGKESGELPRVVITSDNKDAMYQGVLEEVEHYKDMGFTPGQICILTRRGAPAAAIAKKLGESGHRAVFTENLSIFEDSDIHGIISTLISIGNEHRDEYLTGVLLAGYSISNFTLEDLAKITLYSREVGLHDRSHVINRLRVFMNSDDEELKKRVEIFLNWFDEIRSDCVITDISELIERIYVTTGLAASVSDKEKLKVFKDWICTNYMRYGSDIASVATSLEEMKIKLNSSTSVKNSDVSGDMIQCMTYHGSKGLEFPCVIVTDLYTRKQGDEPTLSFDSENGYSAKDFDEETVELTSSIRKVMTEQSDSLAANAEDIRLLYVALTRAQNCLSVVSSMSMKKGQKTSKAKTLYERIVNEPNVAYSRSFWVDNGNSLPSVFLAGILRMTGSTILVSKCREVFENEKAMKVSVPFDGFSMRVIDFTDKVDDDTDDFEDDDAVRQDVTSEDYYKSIIPCEAIGEDETGMPVFKNYQYDYATTVPFKLTVSELNRSFAQDEPGASDSKVKSWALPMGLEINEFSWFMERLNGEVGESASELGTFAHRLFRFIDLESIRSGATYDSAIDELIKQGIIREGDKAKAGKFEDGMVAFATSDIGARVIAAYNDDKAEMEKPIVFSFPVAETTDNLDSALVQGIIDCIIEEEDGYVIIDYKTDSFRDAKNSDERASEAIKKHELQINLYAAAIEQSGHHVKEKYLYLVKYGEFVKLT